MSAGSRGVGFGRHPFACRRAGLFLFRFGAQNDRSSRHFGRSIAPATEFYLKALAPLGYGIVMEVSAEETGHGAAIAFGAPGEAADFQSGKPSFWVGEGVEASAPLHVAFVVEAVPQSMFSIMPRRAGGADNGSGAQAPIPHHLLRRLRTRSRRRTISKPYATALNESRRARLTG